MSLILMVSIAVRMVATVSSAVLWRRVRDWRMGFFTAMLTLMTLRQVLSLRKGVGAAGWNIKIPGDQTELPGLAVSVLAALATLFLARIILERRSAAQTLRQRDAQLRQAQKMEAVGHLAGAVAHDFNNVLTVVFANAQLASANLAKDDPRREALSDIQDAGERGAALIRQLLAFARRQPLAPQPIDVGEVVGGLDPMLRRLLGSQVELDSRRPDTPLTVSADRSQLEQVVVNLAVNARDAMPEGGPLRIEVRAESLGPDATGLPPDAHPGPYVVIDVQDAGEGMTAEVRDRCFEPFFTTKGEEHGSGLGLATCYGVVKQTGGFITIDSAPGRGSTFRVFLPRLAES